MIYSNMKQYEHESRSVKSQHNFENSRTEKVTEARMSNVKLKWKMLSVYQSVNVEELS